MRRNARTLPLMCGLAIAVLTANAPDVAGQGSDAEKAKTEYELGWEALQAEKYEVALEHYQRSYQLVQRPRTLFNIAVSEEKLGRLDDAVRHYTEFVAIAQERDEEFRAEAQRKIEQLARSPNGTIEVVSNPPGAWVFVDGRDTAAGVTPMELELSMGAHELRLVLAGSAPAQRSVTVSAQRSKTESFELTRIETASVGGDDEPTHEGAFGGKGALLIHSGLAGATVSIDGLVVGTTTADSSAEGGGADLRHQLRPGDHDIIVERSGARAWHERLHVSPGETIAIDVAFRDTHVSRTSALTWGLAGVGVVSIAAGGAIGVLALRDVASPEAGDHDRGKTRALVTDLLIAGGAVAIYSAWRLSKRARTIGTVTRTHGRD